jgi:hypothetical protein
MSYIALRYIALRMRHIAVLKNARFPEDSFLFLL